MEAGQIVKNVQDDDDLEVDALDEIDPDILGYSEEQREIEYKVRATIHRIGTQHANVDKEKEAFLGRYPNEPD